MTTTLLFTGKWNLKVQKRVIFFFIVFDGLSQTYNDFSKVHPMATCGRMVTSKYSKSIDIGDIPWMTVWNLRPDFSVSCLLRSTGKCWATWSTFVQVILDFFVSQMSSFGEWSRKIFEFDWVKWWKASWRERYERWNMLTTVDRLRTLLNRQWFRKVF